MGEEPDDSEGRRWGPGMSAEDWLGEGDWVVDESGVVEGTVGMAGGGCEWSISRMIGEVSEGSSRKE